MRLRRLISTLVDAPFSHHSKCDRKIRRLVNERRAGLEKRGLPKQKAQKQALDELYQFVELCNLDPDWIPDLGFAEDNFHVFTNSLDSQPSLKEACRHRFARGSRRAG